MLKPPLLNGLATETKLTKWRDYTKKRKIAYKWYGRILLKKCSTLAPEVAPALP